VTLLVVSFAGAAIAAGVDVAVVTDRQDAMYGVGEMATFEVSAKQGDTSVTKGDFEYTLTIDGAKQVSAGKGRFGSEPAQVEGCLQEPGILCCTVIYRGGDKPVVKYAAAAFDPEKIAPTAVEPDRFADFWKHNKAKLARVPMDARLVKSMKYCDESKTVYKISLGNILGTRVYGWLGVPTNAGPHPAILTVPGAGVYPISAGGVTWAQRGFIAMSISVHDYDVDMPKKRYEELSAGALRSYPFRGRQSRRSYYFLTTFLGCVRAIDYLTSRPEWDGVNVVVNGSSQGGALSIVTAGLDDRVSLIAANVPALCDHSGKFYGRPSGWPRLIPAEDEGGRVRETAGYYDAVNFARYVQCPAAFGVGLIDRTCPATTVYSAFNVIETPKAIVCSPLMGHSQSREYSAFKENWIFEHVFGRDVGAGGLSVGAVCDGYYCHR